MEFKTNKSLVAHKREHKSENAVKTEEEMDVDKGGEEVKKENSVTEEENGIPGENRDENKYPCKYCGKILTTSIGLRIHMRRHTGNNLAECEVSQCLH